MIIPSTDGDLVLSVGNYPGNEVLRANKDTGLLTLNDVTTLDATGALVQPWDGFGADISLATNLLTPTNRFHNWTGTGLMKNLAIPYWAKAGAQITLIAKNATPTVDTTGNIGLVSTIVVGKAITYTLDNQATPKWWPSY